MDRKEVEALLAETKDPMIATLCRTQLAVWDAPSAELLPDSETYRGVELTTPNSARIVVDMGHELGIGQKVRIVPEGGVMGERETLLSAFIDGFKQPFLMVASWLPPIMVGAIIGCVIVLSTVGAVALSAAHAIGPDRLAACALTQPEPPQ